MKKFKRHDGLNETGVIVFEDEDYELVERLSSVILEEIKAYLGSAGYIDGINWMITKKSSADTVKATNWHTDNVGSRLKAFFCVLGDGSQPTLVIPRRRRIPSLGDWWLNTKAELIRWLGEESRESKVYEFSCNHETGSCYIFDTSLLHRGGYDLASSDRIVLHIEFSVPNKHSIINGPIGTNEYNTFRFNEQLLRSDSFRQLLDPKRIIHSHDGYCDYRMK